MINRLFTSFDPSSSIFNFSWLCVLVLLTIISTRIFKSPRFVSLVRRATFRSLLSELRSEQNFFKKSSFVLIIPLLFFVAVLNLSSIYPYVFSRTGHIIVTLWVSINMWISINCMSFTTRSVKYMAHLVPIGTPVPLINFIVLIELVSNTIRPITLSVRLMANMVAGHLLLILLGSIICGLGHKSICIFPTVLLLLVLELSVSLIQSYVLMTLVSLYYKEM